MNEFYMKNFLEKITTTKMIKRRIRVRKQSMSTRARDKNNMYVNLVLVCVSVRISCFILNAGV